PDPPPLLPAIDLLALLDPDRDDPSGSCRKVHGRLEITPFATLQIPGGLPEEYDLNAVVRRVEGREGLGFGLPIGGVSARLLIDGLDGAFSGLHLVDGRPLEQMPEARVGPLLKRGQPAQVVVRIRKTGVQASCNGRSIADWQGDPTRLAAPAELPGDDPQ